MKESCCEYVFERAFDSLVEDKETVFGMIVDIFVYDHCHPFAAGWYAKRSNLGLDKVPKVHLLTVLFLIVVVIDISLAFGLVGSLGFSNFRFKFDFRCSAVEHHCRFRRAYYPPPLHYFALQCALSHLDK